MKGLYQGSLPQKEAKAALAEIEEIISSLKNTSSEKVVWDIENRREEPPSEYDSGCDKTSLYTYFRTTTGRNLAFEIKDNLEAQLQFGGTLEIISYKSISETVR